MIILGIDPGTATTGYGVIQVLPKDILVLEYDLIETKKEWEPGYRLAKIYEELSALIKRVKPDVFAIERLFFATNVKTAMRVGQACGVMLMAASNHNLNAYEYAPGNIKKMLTGSGRANKIEVQKAVMEILGPRVRVMKGKKTHFDNSADALAIALCHVFRVKEEEGVNLKDLLLKKDGKS